MEIPAMLSFAILLLVILISRTPHQAVNGHPLQAASGCATEAVESLKNAPRGGCRREKLLPLCNWVG
jgi:hypothetical protein